MQTTITNVQINGIKRPDLVNPDYTPTVLGCRMLADIMIANMEAVIDHNETVTIDSVRVGKAGF